MGYLAFAVFLLVLQEVAAAIARLSRNKPREQSAAFAVLACFVLACGVFGAAILSVMSYNAAPLIGVPMLVLGVWRVSSSLSRKAPSASA